MNTSDSNSVSKGHDHLAGSICPRQGATAEGAPASGIQRVMDTLVRVNNFVRSITNLEELLTLIMEESRQVVDAEASSLMLFDADRQELYFKVALGEKGEPLKEVRLKLGEGIAGAAAQAGRTINVPDAYADQRFAAWVDREVGFRTRAILAVPLLHRGELIGVVEVVNKVGGGSFNEEDVRVLELLAQQAAVAIRNAQLIAENLRAARLAAIGEAVTGLAHFIKNITAGLNMSGQIIDEALQKGSLEIVRRTWPILRQCTERITRLSHDMLSYSRDYRVHTAPVDVQAVINEVVESVRPRAADRSVSLTVEAIDDIPTVLLDAGSIYRGLLNFLTNALDALDETDKDQKLVAVRCYMRGQPDDVERYIVIEVTDNGPGMDAETRQRIFEPFFSTKGAGGTGLGLAVTQKLARAQGGEVEVESTPGEGSTFRLVLPCRRPEEERIAAEESERKEEAAAGS